MTTTRMLSGPHNESVAIITFLAFENILLSISHYVGIKATTKHFGGGGAGERAARSQTGAGSGAHLRALEALGFHNVLCCNLLHVLLLLLLFLVY